MKKCCFIYNANLYIAPYLQRYIENFNNMEYDVIFWNRELIDEYIGEQKQYSFNYEMVNQSRMKKIKGHIKFARFCRKILKKKDYDYIYVDSLGAVSVGSSILKKYKNRIIYDVRDFTFEKYGWFRRYQKKIVKNAKVLVTCSKGYLSWIPSGNYLICHNTRPIDKSLDEQFRKKNDYDKIRIGYIGMCENYFEMHKKQIDVFKNDDRFELYYFGTGANNLLEHINLVDAKNVFIQDRFKPEEVFDLYKKVNVVNNVYGNNVPHLDTALSNKLYFAALCKMPILVCPNTYMEQIGEEFGLSITVDINQENIKEYVYSQMKQINREKFINSCDRFLDVVNKENQQFVDEIKKL